MGPRQRGGFDPALDVERETMLTRCSIRSAIALPHTLAPIRSALRSAPLLHLDSFWTRLFRSRSLLAAAL